MANLITREMMNSYSTASTGGNVPEGLFIRSVDDFIPIIGRTDTPLIKMIGTGSTGNKLKREWGDGDLAPRQVTVTVAGLAADTEVTVDSPKNVQQYDVLLNTTTGEQFRAGSAPSSTQLTGLVRGHGGSTAAVFTEGDVLLILGPAVPEGADTPESPIMQGDLDWNTYQIFEYSWTFTHRGRVTPTYEVKSDRFKHELKRKMDEAARDLNRTAIYGLRALGDGSKTNPSTTGGLRQFAKSNVFDLNGDPLTLSTFLDLLQQQYEDVGQNDMAKTFYGNAMAKRIVNSFFNPTRRATSTDAKLNITVDTISTDFGDIKFVIDYEWPDGELHTLNLADIKRHAYEGGNWSTGLFSTMGWYDTGFLRGDFGFSWQAARRRGAILDFSTTKADYPDLDKVGSNAS